jgi:hypothetical protein
MEEKNNNNSKEQSNLVDIGAFWKKTKNGKTFLSGKVKISDKEFVAFIFNNNKSKPNQPDYRLVLSDLDEDLKPLDKKSKPTAKNNHSDQSIDDSVENQDDIPF